MRKIRYVTLLPILMLLLLSTNNVSAAEHKLEQLYIHVFLHNDGSATITEKRNAYLTEGTENYDVIENLGDSKVTDFVVEEDGVIYEYIDDWDIDASQSEKAFKNGIIETKNGYELAWGIGEYGRHEYTIQYNVTNFIKQLRDSQILFWRFVNDDMNTPPESLTIEIEADRAITEQNEKIWGFGFEGRLNFVNGKVVAKNVEPLMAHNYATVLIKFPDQLFRAKEFIDKPFTEVKDEAFEGSDYGKEQNDISFKTFILACVIILTIFIPFFLIFAFLFYKPYREGKKRRKLKRQYEGHYNRDLPFQEDFFDLFYLLQKIKEANINSLITAYFLKWIYEERVTVETEVTGVFKKKHKATLHFHNVTNVEDKHEQLLLKILSEVAGPTRQLKQGNYTSWTEENKEKFTTWKNDIEIDSRKKLEELGYITLANKKTIITEKGKNVQINVYKFANYLQDYSLLNERGAADVTLWDQLMIAAAMLGLTDVVREQFQTLYPHYVEETVYPLDRLDSLTTFSAYITIANTSIIDSSSSGGGGFTSSGGGGGSFGGGSGGGTR